MSRPFRAPIAGLVLSALIPLARPARAQQLHLVLQEARTGMTEALIDTAAALPYEALSGDLDAAIELERLALSSMHARHEAGPRLGDVMLLLSTAHYLRGSADSATHYGLAAVEVFQGIGDDARAGHAQCAIAYNMKRRDLNAAFDLMRRGISTLRGADARWDLAGDYNKFGVLHEMAGALDSARHYYQRSYELKLEVGDSLTVPFSMNCLGTVEHMRGDFLSAEQWFTRALNMRNRRGDAFGVAEEMLYFGELYEAWGRADQAIAAYEDALFRTEQVGYPRGRQQAYDRLSALYEQAGRLPEALASARSAAQLKDSLLEAERARAVLDLEQRYRVSEKDRDLLAARAEAQQRRLIAWATGIGALLVLAIGALWLQRRQSRLRSERDAAVIAEREQGLKAVFDATEKERARLARDLHDGIGQQLGGLKHRLEHLRGAHADARLDASIAIVDETAIEVRGLAHQLMPRSLSRLGLLPAMQDLVHRTFEGSPVKAAFDHVGIDDELPTDAATGIYRIAQELISNVLRHAHATTIDVQLLRNKGHLVLLVQDDGVGIPEKLAAEGLGMRSMADRARALGGTFAIERTGERGTLATVRIPLHREPDDDHTRAAGR